MLLLLSLLLLPLIKSRWLRGASGQTLTSHRCAGVPISRLSHSMWVSWWMKRDLGRFSWGLSPFSPATNFIPLCLHTHLIHFVLFHFIRTSDGASGVGGLAFLLFTDLQTKGLHRMSSLAPALCRTRVEDILGQGFQPFEFECQFISFI